MFNDKQKKSERKFPLLGAGAAAIAFAVTFSKSHRIINVLSQK